MKIVDRQIAYQTDDDDDDELIADNTTSRLSSRKKTHGTEYTKYISISHT